jgi:hypothetical protein
MRNFLKVHEEKIINTVYKEELEAGSWMMHALKVIICLTKVKEGEG